MNDTRPAWPVVADLILKILVAVGAVIAFGIGIQQYERAQAWQRATVVISLIDSFEKDPQIRIACEMLDWDGRKITLDGSRTLNFRNEMLLSTLRVLEMDVVPESQVRGDSGQETAFTEDEMVMRDAFDKFFDFFDKLNGLEKGGLVKLSDYSYFNYWLELLRDVGRYKKNPALQETLDTYMRKYNFFGVQQLLKKYSKNPQPLEIMS